MHESEYAREIAWTFKARRAELGLSQRQVAEATGGVVSYAALSRIESGARATRGQSLATLAALARVLSLRIVIDPAGVTAETVDEEQS